MTSERVGVIVVAAGRSERMGFDKVWSSLAGEPVLCKSLRTFAEAGLDELTLVVARDQVNRARALMYEMNIGARVTAGGARRRDSVLAGLNELPHAAWIAVHDAARPLVSGRMIRDGLEAAKASGVAVPVIPVADTVKRVAGDRVVETVPRGDLRLIQTPQVFRRDLLAWALNVSDDDFSDEAGMIEQLGGIVYTFQGDPRNVKLTYPDDLATVERMLGEASGSGLT